MTPAPAEARWVSAPLTWCPKCSGAHDESASCGAVAAANKRNQHRAKVTAMVERVWNRRNVG